MRSHTSDLLLHSIYPCWSIPNNYNEKHFGKYNISEKQASGFYWGLPYTSDFLNTSETYLALGKNKCVVPFGCFTQLQIVYMGIIFWCILPYELFRLAMQTVTSHSRAKHRPLQITFGFQLADLPTITWRTSYTSNLPFLLSLGGMDGCMCSEWKRLCRCRLMHKGMQDRKGAEILYQRARQAHALQAWEAWLPFVAFNITVSLFKK